MFEQIESKDTDDNKLALIVRLIEESEKDLGIDDKGSDLVDRLAALLGSYDETIKLYQKAIDRSQAQQQTIIDNLSAANNSNGIGRGNDPFSHYYRDRHSEMLIEIIRHYQREIKEMLDTHDPLDDVPW